MLVQKTKIGQAAKKIFIVLAGFMIVSVVCAGLFFKADVQATVSTDKVRVVLPNISNAGYVNVQNGEITGYFMDYLGEIAKHTGWEYDIRVVSDPQELLEIAESKDFDLMLGVDYSDESDQKYFDYPDMDMGFKHLVVATTKTHTNLTKRDLFLLKGAKIGVTTTESNQNLKEKFASYCFTNGLKCRTSIKADPQGVTLLTTPEEGLFQRLQNGHIDAILCSDSIALENNLFEVADFGMIALYPVVPDGDRRYIKQLNAALEHIDTLEAGFVDRLYEKYFASNYVRVLAFNSRERKFLETERTYRVAIGGESAPYSYQKEDGTWAGVAIEVFNEITRMTGGKLKFEIVGCESMEDAGETVANDEADILGMSFSTLDMAEKGASRSKTFYTDHFYLFRNQFSEKSLEEGTIAIKQHLPAAIRAEFQLPSERNVVKAANIAEALQMVDSGEVDFTFALQNVADYYMSYEQLKNVTEVNVDVCTVYFCSVFSDDFDRTAMDICNKCITHIDESIFDRYIKECIIQDVKKHTFADYVREHWYYFAAGAALILLIIIVMLTIGIINISGKTKKIQKMLYCDDVTGGYSYLKFVADVNKLFEENKEPCYIMFADISNFKYINDTYGYAAGDKVLAAVEKFGAQLVEGYPVARMYADHFVGVCAYQEREALEEKLQKGFAEFDRRIRVAFRDFNVFLKVGVYYWDRSADMQIEQMVNYANYAADNLINLFRSEYCFYSAYMHDRVLKTQQIEKDMHRAMNAGEFIAYYQPKVDAYTNQIVGAEALVRWKHRDRGLVSPGEFVPVFEQNHFIREVDFCVYERTCAMLASRMAKGQKIVPISCNFSRLHFYQQDFYQRDFVERLIEILNKYQVPAQYIELEITETVAAEDFDRLIETVQRLKTIGFLISIDDFGSGYSSIQLLYRIPIDVLKLDRVFVCEKCKNKREEEVYRNLISICNENNIKIICEGVETNEQKDFIMSYGCRYIQGFLYSRPLPDNEFQAMLDNESMT